MCPREFCHFSEVLFIHANKTEVIGTRACVLLDCFSTIPEVDGSLSRVPLKTFAKKKHCTSFVSYVFLYKILKRSVKQECVFLFWAVISFRWNSSFVETALLALRSCETGKIKKKPADLIIISWNWFRCGFEKGTEGRGDW